MASAAVPESNEFVTYLEGLNLKNPDKTKPKPGVCYQASIDAAHAAGNEKLTKSLLEQKEKHQQEMTKAKTDHEQRFKDELGRRYRIKPEIVPFISFIGDFIKELQRLDRNKSDIECSSSTWKIDRFKKYINTFKINFVKPYHRALTEASPPHFPAYNVPDGQFSSIQQRYLELASVYLGVQVTQELELGQDVSFLKKLQNCDFREATTRLFIDALITPILRGNGMQARLEEKLYQTKDWNPTVPNCIADYVIYSGSGDILGAIETKAGGSLNAESVIQCMLQLLALRRKAPRILFGVVTDGVQYMFIVLAEDGAFEFERDPGVRQARSYGVKTWGDLRQIVGVFTRLLERRQSLKGKFIQSYCQCLHIGKMSSLKFSFRQAVA